MTNTLIPYSFIPGTKAKASEVNANFIALAEEIQSTQTSTAEGFEELSEDISEGFGEIADKCIFDTLIDKRTLSYCIVSAPNGVISYSDGILTISSGLKLATPNGKNADGSLKSTEYTLSEDITVDMTSYSNGTRRLWLENGGSYFFSDINSYYIRSSEPSTSLTDAVWYNPETNLLKKYNSGTSTWDTKNAVYLGKVVTSGGYITSIDKEKPFSILSSKDFIELSVINHPSSKKIDLTASATGGAYTMPDNGYFAMMGTCRSSGYMDLVNNTVGLLSAAGGSTNYPIGVYLPVRKGDSVSIFYYNTNISALRFFYMEGNK